MAGEQDDSGRFDYLFEPLDNDLANTQDIAVPTVEQADADERRSRTAATRIGIAAVVVAMIAVAIATVLLLLQRPHPASRLDAPTTHHAFCRADRDNRTRLPGAATRHRIPHRTSASDCGRRAAATRATATPTGADDVGRRERTQPPSPTMRAPISVEPEPHPPFPNQNAPSGNDDQGGGLRPRRTFLGTPQFARLYHMGVT